MANGFFSSRGKRISPLYLAVCLHRSHFFLPLNQCHEGLTRKYANICSLPFTGNRINNIVILLNTEIFTPPFLAMSLPSSSCRFPLHEYVLSKFESGLYVCTLRMNPALLHIPEHAQCVGVCAQEKAVDLWNLLQFVIHAEFFSPWRNQNVKEQSFLHFCGFLSRPNHFGR